MPYASGVPQGSRYVAPRHEHLLRNVAYPKRGYGWCSSVIVPMIPTPKTALSFFLIVLAWASQAAEITEAPATRVNSLAPAFSDGDILVLYDTDTRHFLWRAELTHSRSVSMEIRITGV